MRCLVPFAGVFLNEDFPLHQRSEYVHQLADGRTGPAPDVVDRPWLGSFEREFESVRNVTEVNVVADVVRIAEQSHGPALGYRADRNSDEPLEAFPGQHGAVRVADAQR